MAQLIVERATLMNHLLPQEGISNGCAECVLIAMIDLFYVYLTKAQHPQNEAIQWVCIGICSSSFIHCATCGLVTLLA